MGTWRKNIRSTILALSVGVSVCSLQSGFSVAEAAGALHSPKYFFSMKFPRRIADIRQGQARADRISLPDGTQPSGNWAGYIVTPSPGNSGYTSVSGSWTVPNITGSRNSVAAQWIGLGGVSTQDLLQMGTMEQMQNGQPVAVVFWEQLPDPAQIVMTIPIGSTIDASISKSANETQDSTWDIKFTVHSPNGKTETKTIPVQLDSDYAQAIGTSAEWISEDPSRQTGRLFPLANAGTVTFHSTLANGQPINAAGNQVQPVALASNFGDVLIAPSALSADGQSFSTTTLATTGTASISDGQNGLSWRIWRRIQKSWGLYPGFGTGLSYGFGFGYGR
jgi:hypothetical protein